LAVILVFLPSVFSKSGPVILSLAAGQARSPHGSDHFFRVEDAVELGPVTKPIHYKYKSKIV
jgi:hypothetical protein